MSIIISLTESEAKVYIREYSPGSLAQSLLARKIKIKLAENARRVDENFNRRG